MPTELVPRTIDVSPAQAGVTLAALLRAAYADLSWAKARALCERGKVQVDGALATDPARRLRGGERVEVAPEGRRLKPQGLPERALVYCDHHVVVVDKPAGLLTVPFEPEDRDTLVERVQRALRDRRERDARDTDVGAATELGVVQRLDKDTTGVLVFARTLAAKRHLQQLLRRHDVERRYLALVHGVLDAPRRIESHILRDRGDGLRGSYGHFRRPRGPVPASAQRALTEVRPLQALRGATLVECRLHTGRQHQIRIHLSELGHPLIGETVYIRDHEGPTIAAARPMLHAAVLGFAHPRDGRLVRFEREPPSDFEALRAKLQLKPQT